MSNREIKFEKTYITHLKNEFLKFKEEFESVKTEGKSKFNDIEFSEFMEFSKLKIMQELVNQLKNKL